MMKLILLIPNEGQGVPHTGNVYVVPDGRVQFTDPWGSVYQIRDESWLIANRLFLAFDALMSSLLVMAATFFQ